MTTRTSSQGAAATVVAPTKVDTAIPTLAAATAATRVRVTP
ncbi:hypothetical protein CU044_3224 [Streptomyces sp. L-9-10]|nr:hypothetical protein CU044_3224 [Streptomyces sp. L-9-10]